MKKSVLQHFLMLLVLPLFWGSTFLGTQICLQDLPPIWMGAIRYSLSSLLFLGVLWMKDRSKKPLRDLKNSWLLFVAVGVVGTFFAAFFQNIGLRYTTASTSSLIGTLEPVLVAILSFFILKERMPWIGVVGLVLAFTGGFVIISNGDPSSLLHLSGTVKGNLLIFGSILSYAFYTIFTKLLVNRTDPLSAVTFSTVIGSILLLIGAVTMEELPNFAQVSTTTWLAIVYMAVFPTCIALLLFNQLLTKVDASRTSIILFLIPTYGLALGIVFLKDPLTPAMIFGGLLTICGVWLIEYGPTKILKQAVSID